MNAFLTTPPATLRAIPRASAHAARTATLLLVPLLLLTACQGDSTPAAPIDCAEQPGCQTFGAPVATVVLDALDDARSRVISSLDTRSRNALDAPLRRLHDALADRDLLRGRVALSASMAAIAQAERDLPDAAAEFGAIRLALVPAARALLLDADYVLRHAA